MKAAYSRFLPDILPAKTIVVRHKRTGKPPPAAHMPEHKGKPTTFHNSQNGNSVKLLYRQIKWGNGQKQSLRGTTGGLIAQLSDLSLLLAELNNLAMRGRAF